MAAVPCTNALGSFIELGALPLQRDAAGTDNLVLALFRDISGTTVTALRDCDTYDEMLDEGAIVCNFSGYNPKILGPADRTIGRVTGVAGVSPWKQTLTVPVQIWNPAGGAIDNVPVLSALLYRRTTSTALGDCRTLGICQTSGGAASGSTYQHTFGVMTSQAA